MDNRHIARHFDLLAKLYELHEENPFKVRSYSSAYQVIRRMDEDLTLLGEAELLQIKGIGKAVAGKILELLSTGQINALEEVKAKTPEGILDILKRI